MLKILLTPAPAILVTARIYAIIAFFVVGVIAAAGLMLLGQQTGGAK